MSNGDHFNVKPIAHLARLDLTAAELAEYAVQLEHILGYVAKLDGLDVTGVEPTAHPNPIADVTRADVARAGIGADLALLNAPRQAQSQFGVPKVVE
jgi:aspartyl-tRNA(Asn)/glutamyl-tRNA(Gln) amidotransferase subunit C